MSVKSKKILEDIHPLHIIREVQKWPALYAKDCPERANLHFKNKIWGEVAKALFPEYDSYDNKEKDRKVIDLVKKWRNLRDTFKRQLAIEKKIREGYDIKKKTYVYFKHMLFLLPHITCNDHDISEPILEPKLDEFFDKREKRKASNEKKEVKRPKYYPQASTSHQELIDEDRHFLMSLIPSFKKMTDDEKLTAKMDILKVIKDVRSKSVRRETTPIMDSLSYEDANVGEIKVELLQPEPVNEIQSVESDSVDSDMPSD